MRPVLSLGKTPLANALLHVEQLQHCEPTYDLELVVCPNCTLVQITTTVPPSELFRDYVYFSSFSDTMIEHVRQLVNQTIITRQLGPEHRVVEIASNDGYLLQFYRQQGIPVLGIEPAENIAQVARERGIETACEFFDLASAQRMTERGQMADVVHAHNVLAHVPDPNQLVAGFHQLLRADGVVIVEVPYVKELLDKVEFDTIYHEHMSYFSLTSLQELFQRHSMVITDVKQVAIHGGSLRVHAGRMADQPRVDESVGMLLAEEATWVRSPTCYDQFRHAVWKLRGELTTLLDRFKGARKRIAVYGASAKGSTLLNYCGVGPETVDFVVDRSTVKQGRYTPGSHLRIYAPEKLLEEQPDYVLLLTWNFADEIREQQREYQLRGGRFIIPIPEVKVA